MVYYLEYNDAREQVDKKYREMGYERARELIKYFSSAEVITFADRTRLSDYLNAIYCNDQDKKRKKRQANKLKRKKKK